MASTDNEKTDPTMANTDPPLANTDTNDSDEDFVDAFNALDSNLKPADSISQKGQSIDNVDDDDNTSVAPTLVAPDTKSPKARSSSSPPPATTQTPTTRTDKFTSTGDIIFSFGPEAYYFVCTRPGQVAAREKVGMPLIAMIKSDSMGHVYMHSFSPHGDEFALYKNAQGACTWIFHQGNDKSITYRSLRDWLVTNVNLQSKADILNSRVVFGEGASYYASNGKTCIHNDLPTRLSNEIEKRRAGDNGVLPNILSLGANETYFARWPNNGGSIWKLSTTSRLHARVSSSSDNFTAESNLAYIFLSPIDDSRYVTVLQSGMLEYQILDSEGDVQKVFRGYMQLKAKETNATFPLEFLSGAGLKDSEVTYISPETKYEFPKGHKELEREKKEKKEKKKEGKEAAKSSSPTATTTTTKRRFSLFGRKGET